MFWTFSKRILVEWEKSIVKHRVAHTMPIQALPVPVCGRMNLHQTDRLCMCRHRNPGGPSLPPPSPHSRPSSSRRPSQPCHRHSHTHNPHPPDSMPLPRSRVSSWNGPRGWWGWDWDPRSELYLTPPRRPRRCWGLQSWSQGWGWPGGGMPMGLQRALRWSVLG